MKPTKPLSAQFVLRICRLNRLSHLALFFIVACASTLNAQNRTVLLISVDGMKPEYVTKADEHGLKVPNMRKMMQEGAYAEGVIGVVPTVTYPSHTTLVTGVWPEKHGIYANTTFDPERKNLGGWYWYFEDIKVPTLWDAAKSAGLTTASVNWPVTVGAPVNYLLPEIWRTGTADDLKLLRAVSTPGLMAKLESTLGAYPEPINSSPENDRMRTKFAIAILQQYKPKLMAVHLAALDHAEHETGPFSTESNAVMEQIDEMIGQLRDAALAIDPQTVICVVSDHGFMPTNHRLNLTAAFVKAGLMEPGTDTNSAGAIPLKSWQASPWISGGLAAIILKDPKDEAVTSKVRALLKQLAADPRSGINRIVERDELKKLGGFPNASFLVDLKSGYQFDTSLNGEIFRDTKPNGTHGYLPEHPELRSSFFIAGAGIAKARMLGVIDMRQIAPTLAGLFGGSLPTADGKPLPVTSQDGSISNKGN
jgi:predicted AlkP superfamily pyrophosphatase or phosphodiesterase